MNFDKLLRPSSVAVIGASADESKAGNSVLTNIIAGGFKGGIYPVNPKASEIAGLRCYPVLSSIPGPVIAPSSW
jgi:acyl-CoA synthetase (NDP forming)